ncbi:MAG: ComF family protein [Clostridia bacterium]|nr:ComF family protein [Clostridia bacterium]
MNTIKVKEKFDKFINFLFPLNHTCNLCGREIFSGDYFCKDCESQITYNDKTICNHCGRRTFNSEEYCTSCSGRETYFEKARSAYVYAGALKPLIANFKYHNKKYLAKIFAKELSLLYYKSFFNCDFVLFTPMTDDRKEERGYNQARVLAEEFCKVTKLTLIDDCLIKSKETPRQATTESVKERRLNLKGSFKVENKQKIKGKRLLLIDDVMTTGATVEIICETLKKAGVKAVYVLTVASVSKGPERID